MGHSKYQTDIFDFVAHGSGHGEVIAGAGTGKTYTAVKSCSHIPRGMATPKTVFLAFNKHIQTELEAKLNGLAEARTYHSFGLSAIPNARSLKITSYKNNDILTAKFGKRLESMFPVVSRITGLCKGNLISDIDHETVNNLVDQYGIEIDDEMDCTFDDIVEGVKYCMDPDHIERIGKLDFDDMIWYPLVRKMPFPKVDYLLVDEFQDSNESQMEMVMRAKNSHGRILAIGDPNQAIYGWRGAGTKGMEIFADRTKATVLPLSISYRCPKAVVQYVNQRFPQIPFEAWDQAIEGEVNLAVPETAMMQKLNPGDMVLCRLNAPLVAPAMACLRMGKKAIIRGKDIGKNLITLIRQVQRKYSSTSLAEFCGDLTEYVEKESAKLRATNRLSQADLLEDKAETVYAFAEGVDSVAEMIQMIEKIFDDDTPGITFSSGHRAKGLEADHVYIIKPELFPFKRAKTEEAKKQEQNLAYVVCTRSKVSLNFVV